MKFVFTLFTISLTNQTYSCMCALNHKQKWLILKNVTLLRFIHNSLFPHNKSKMTVFTDRRYFYLLHTLEFKPTTSHTRNTPITQALHTQKTDGVQTNTRPHWDSNLGPHMSRGKPGSWGRKSRMSTVQSLNISGKFSIAPGRKWISEALCLKRRYTKTLGLLI